MPHRGRSTPLPPSPCSTAGLLPQDMTTGLLRACFCRVFHLPGHEDGTDMDTSLYFRVCTGWALGMPLLCVRAPQALSSSSLQTVEALDSLLQALVSSAGACSLLELQNILKVGLGDGWASAGRGHGHPPGQRSGGTTGRSSAPCCGHTSSFSPPSSCCPSPSSSRRPWRRGPWRGSPGWSPSSTPAPCPR